MTHICVSNLNTIGSDNGLSPGQRQAIIRTNAEILFIRTLGINFNEILIEIHTFSFKKIILKKSSGNSWPFCLGLNALMNIIAQTIILLVSCLAATMSPDYRTLCVCVLLAMQQCQALLYSEDEGDYPEVSRRSARAPSCHSCYNDPSDWVNCLACYEGSSVPFYGQKRSIYPTKSEPSKRGFFDDNRDWAKRGFLDTDRDWAKRSPFPGYFDDDRDWIKRDFFDSNRDWAKRSFFDTDRDWSKRSDDGKEEKRSRFMDCKCCMITRKASCCQGCNYVPYYGGNSLQKRVYAPRQQSFYGQYCPCCQRGSFDFGCCLTCALK